MPLGCIKPYPVAMIPYVNMLPYRLSGPPPHCCWHDHVPRESVAALKTGKVMAAAVPVGALPALGNCVEALGHYGIGAREASMSVLFFSVRPFDRICVDDRIQLTPDSATSVRLLYLLLSRRRPSDAAYADGTDEDPVGELIIGDRAMQRMHARRRTKIRDAGIKVRRERYPHVTDLAACWYESYGRPFVFARWVIRRDAPSEARAILTDWLENFERRERELIDRSIPLAARRLGLPEVWFEEYYRCLRRVLQAEDLNGQAVFLDEIQEKQIDRLVTPSPLGQKGEGLKPLRERGRPVPSSPKVAQYMQKRTRLRWPVSYRREASST